MSVASASVLTTELLNRCRDRAPLYDRENRFFQEDFDELRAAGYLGIALPKEFGRVINIVEAAEMLDFVDTPKRMVVLDPPGKRFVRASAEERQVLWRGQLLKLRLFREVYEVLQRERTMDKDILLETIVMSMPHENYEKIFETFIRWARFGNLFAYDETTETISLQEQLMPTA